MIKDIILLMWAVGAVEARSDVTSERSEVSRHFINFTYRGESAFGENSLLPIFDLLKTRLKHRSSFKHKESYFYGRLAQWKRV